MAAAVNLRTPALLTRSWVVTPSYHNFRAGKHLRKNTSFAYRCFIEIPHHHIRRSCDPIHVRASRQDGKRQPSPSTRLPVRQFSQSGRARAVKTSAIPHISLHIAASSSGKGSKFQAEKSTYDYDQDNGKALGLQSSEKNIFQKRRARPDSGQDAYFVAPIGYGTGDTAFGLCDGVGGWADHGIDPADFSHGLCSHMARTAIEWPSISKEQERLKPQHLLELGYQATVKDTEINAGGSTACIAVTDGNGHMSIANLGDSGYIQLRLGSVQHYSTPQTHAFNTPYQLSLTPHEMLVQAAIFGGLPINDLPERADIAHHDLQHGDVLVLATDGLWDNLSSQDILTIVSNQMRQHDAWHRTTDKGFVTTDKLAALVSKSSAMSQHNLPGTLQSVIAATIVAEAKAASQNKKRDGPFAKAWQKQMPYDAFHGGKVDDITVLVMIPVEHNEDGEQLVKAKL